MGEYLENVTASFGAYLPNLLAALAVLIVGWLVALFIAWLVKKLLQRTTIDNRLASWLAGEKDPPPKVEDLISKIVFWILMIFVLIAFFQVLGLAFVAGPLEGFLDEVFGFLPNLLSAAILILIAWVLAKGLRFVVQRAAQAARLDERLSRETAADETAAEPVSPGEPAAHAAPPRKPVSLANTLGETVYWLVFLLFLPAILDALSLEGLLAPVNDLVQKILGFLPNLLAAVLIFAVGWLVARILQRIVTNLLAATGLDRLGDRVGISKVMGGRGLSGVVGLVLYILILIPVIIAALNALQIESITRPASEMLNDILAALPRLFAAALVILIAYVVGRVLAGLISNLLSSLGFDRFLSRLGFGAKAEAGAETPPGRKTPSEIVGYLVMVALILFATVEALRLLQFDALAALVAQFVIFAGDVILGVVIFGLGYYLAHLAAEAILSSRLANAQLLATIAKVAIIVLAAAMALGQMGMAEDIILLAFGLSLGAVAIAAAIAFGMGGREVASRYLERWARSAESSTGGSASPPPSRPPGGTPGG